MLYFCHSLDCWLNSRHKAQTQQLHAIILPRSHETVCAQYERPSTYLVTNNCLILYAMFRVWFWSTLNKDGRVRGDEGVSESDVFLESLSLWPLKSLKADWPLWWHLQTLRRHFSSSGCHYFVALALNATALFQLAKLNGKFHIEMSRRVYRAVAPVPSWTQI